MTTFHLENLPFDPAQEAGKYSREVESIEAASLAQRQLDKQLKSHLTGDQGGAVPPPCPTPKPPFFDGDRPIQLGRLAF